MAAITIQQAYAIALGAYQSSSGNVSFVPSFLVNSTQNRLKKLLDGTSYSGIIGGVGVGTSLITITNVPYTLVTTSTNVTPSVLDYISGGDIDNNSFVIPAEEIYHKTGLGLLKKIKK